MTPYGTEAMHVLRAEKGYIIVGQETDGTVTPDDLGLDWAIGKPKPDFVGKRSLTRPDMLAPDRKQLVGLLDARSGDQCWRKARRSSASAEPGPGDARARPRHLVLSRAPTLGRSIALALVARRARPDGRDRLHVPMPGGAIAARSSPSRSSTTRKERASMADTMGAWTLRRASPLGGFPADMGSIGGVTLGDAGPAARFILRGEDAAGCAGAVLGVDPPRTPLRAASGGSWAALWLGPDEWLLIGPQDAADATCARARGRARRNSA